MVCVAAVILWASHVSIEYWGLPLLLVYLIAAPTQIGRGRRLLEQMLPVLDHLTYKLKRVYSHLTSNLFNNHRLDWILVCPFQRRPSPRQ